MHHPSIQDSANAALVSSAKGTAINRGGGYPYINEDYEPLVGLTLRLRRFPYWITGYISGLRRRSGYWVPIVFIKMLCVALDGERRAPRPPSHSPARVRMIGYNVRDPTMTYGVPG